MKVELWARNYNTFGGLTSCEALCHLFRIEEAEFGPAIRTIEVTLLFAHPGPPLKTLEEIFANYHLYREAKLPKVTFRRTRETVVIDVASNLIDGKDWAKVRVLSPDLFRLAAEEVLEALRLLRKSVKRKDEFRLEDFLSHCEAALQCLPQSEAELASLTAEASAAAERRRAALSPWDTLDIDFRDYHPSARSLLDDPFFWDCTDEFAPHGNDAGADLLEEYRKWLKRHPKVDPLEYHLALLDSWGYDPNTNEELFHAEVQDAAVGLAFAEFKLRGSCRQSAFEFALEVLDEQQREAEEALDWEHREARLIAIAKNRAALQSAPKEPSDD